MNSKLLIFGLMISSLLTISASGQKVKTIQDVILQDDKSGDQLIFVITTGEYKFESCKGNFSTSGVGTVEVTGCKVTLRDMSDTIRLLAEVDLCAGAGKANIAFQGGSLTSQNDTASFEALLSDSSTQDSKLDCDLRTIEVK